jgi:hypothetical protein
LRKNVGEDTNIGITQNFASSKDACKDFDEMCDATADAN